MPSSSKWFIDIDTSFESDVQILPVETLSFSAMITPNVYTGRACTEIDLDTVADLQIGQNLYTTGKDALATILATTSGSVLVTYYDSNTFSFGDVLNSSYTIGGVHHLRAMIYADYINDASDISIVIHSGENTGTYHVKTLDTPDVIRLSDGSAFKQHTGPVGIENFTLINNNSITMA